MRIAITGSNGMIGAYLSKYYSEQGHHIVEINRNTCDLSDATSVEHLFGSNDIQTVIHCALYGREKIYTQDSDVYDVNWAMFENLYNNRHRFRCLINLGSGNEYNTEQNIYYAQESDIFKSEPPHTYGLVKNHISRRCSEIENFYTLRLFGVMHYTETANRFFKKLLVSPNFTITQDKYFDYLNLEDLPSVIDTVLNRRCKHNQMNVVYSEKYKLSDLAKQFCAIQNIDAGKISVGTTSENNFVGDPTRLEQLGLSYLGLPLGMLRY